MSRNVHPAVAELGQLRPVKPGRSLADQRPLLSAEWNRELNGGATPAEVALSANLRAWWNCPAGHEPYLALIANRSLVGTGCPRCRAVNGGRTTSAVWREARGASA
ncbi:zinc-ribbon domain-containing protein [Tersicoccus mangrovi]|uniref:zinc-ribbon domain-containing protein n=1 Tax=Tersicoccus mangrovi TaxID=3121635 RepID=UPI003A7F3AAF